ncbi:MAG TPA: hypothetical protein VMK42_01730 [Anaeromyxobacteraceae bacterium]|nr:hypothetical protein [Anaeromyxobacteraceae bacterium]
MPQPRAPALLALWLAACAAHAPPPPPKAPAPAGGTVARAPAPVAPVTVGLGAAALREAWGEPSTTRTFPSPSSGVVYERWTWGSPGEGREAVLVDGKVIDFLDPSTERGTGDPASPPPSAGDAHPASAGQGGRVPPEKGPDG